MTLKDKSAKEIIIEVLRKAGKPLSVQEIRDITKLNYNTIRGRLYDLKKKGLVRREEDGWIIK